MELSELTAYAEEKFHIHEQLKWDDFPGFSILADPGTGKWIALLMRQWDSDTGTEIQRCDLKCGQESLAELREPYLSRPFRMKGKKWVGVIFDRTTKPDVVFRLFDRAVYSGEPQGYTIVLEDAPAAQMIVDDISGAHTAVHRDTALSFAGSRAHGAEEDVPEKIRAMRRLYRYRSSSFPQKCRNFCRQAKFMEDYEDDAPWTGEYKRYFPTYHDLNTRQLRGYFTWRTHVRKGEFTPVATSLAYLYLYELLNGIGTDSPEDGFEKMRKFETGYLDSGIGDPGMYKNLHRWMLEYAVIHGLPPELVASCVPSADMEKDVCLAVLRTPEEAEDEEIFSALCCFAGKKLEQSAVVRKDEKRGKHLLRRSGAMYAGHICRTDGIFLLPVSENRGFFCGVPLPMPFTGRRRLMQMPIMCWMRADPITAAAACGGKNGTTNCILTGNGFPACCVKRTADCGTV